MITIANHQRRRRIDTRWLREVALALEVELQIEHAQLEINLLGARKMARLNEAFLRHAGPTDVIAFNYGDDLDARGALAGHGWLLAKAAGASLQGEIFVCVDEAIRQARRYRTTWPAELVRYVVHGVLHLCGYKDARPGARRRMKRDEDHLLRTLLRRRPLGRLPVRPHRSGQTDPRPRSTTKESLHHFPLSRGLRASRLRG